MTPPDAPVPLTDSHTIVTDPDRFVMEENPMTQEDNFNRVWDSYHNARDHGGGRCDCGGRSGSTPLTLRPVTLAEARRFVGQHHRHNLPPRGHLFSVGVEARGELVGVAIASRPVARMLDDGRTIEVVRTCTDGTENANSKLYGAVIRAASALGYERAYTYTLATESGASLKASGWTRDADLTPRPSWDTPSRPRQQIDLFGNDRRPPCAKVRWIKRLVP